MATVAFTPILIISVFLVMVQMSVFCECSVVPSSMNNTSEKAVPNGKDGKEYASPLVIVENYLAIIRKAEDKFLAREINANSSDKNVSDLVDEIGNTRRDPKAWESDVIEAPESLNDPEDEYLLINPQPEPVLRGRSSGKYNKGGDIGNNNELISFSVPSLANRISSYRTQLEINHILHPVSQPFVNFTVKSDTIMYNFEVHQDYMQNYYISVVLEKMKCPRGRATFGVSKEEARSPTLFIGGEHNKFRICANVDNSANHFQSVTDFADGEKYVNITGTGNWTNMSASLVATIYYETSSCATCPYNHFCCGSKDSSCDAKSKFQKARTTRTSEQKRCIPKTTQKGVSLLCDRHPNCGLPCSLDEYCGKDGAKDDDECPGYYCGNYNDHKQNQVILIFLLIMFSLLVVPLCIFVFCWSLTRKDIRRQCGARGGRCPLPLEIVFCPLSMNPSETDATGVPISRSRHHAGAQRHVVSRGNTRPPRITPENFHTPAVMSSSSFDNYSYFDDLPPPYTECVNNKEAYPHPSQSQDVISTISAPHSSSFVELRNQLDHRSEASTSSRPIPLCSCSVVSTDSGPQSHHSLISPGEVGIEAVLISQSHQSVDPVSAAPNSNIVAGNGQVQMIDKRSETESPEDRTMMR